MDPLQRIAIIESKIHDVEEDLKALKLDLRGEKKAERTPFDIRRQMKDLTERSAKKEDSNS
jgi:hypothetical protein